MLKEYLTLKMEIAEKQVELDRMLVEIQTQVNSTGTPMREWGSVAYFKNGRKSTDHKQAALDAGVSDEIVDEFTRATPRTAWAKVTKKARVDTADYETWGDPVFVIEMED